MWLTQLLSASQLAKRTTLVLCLALLAILLGCLGMIINQLTTHYTGFNYLPWRWVIFAPIIFALLLLGLYAQDKSPRLAFFTVTYCTYFFIIFSFAVLTIGIQYTPFPTIDHHLLALDQRLGFNTLALMQWTAQHPRIKIMFELAYELLNIEIIVIPLLLGLLHQETRVFRLFVMMLVAFMLGAMIYYFLPTAAPVSVLSSSYFLSDQQATALKFYEIHHHLAVTTGDGGLIAFPSFHVIWAILLSLSLRDNKWLFYVSVVINSIVILATLFLGWHYLVDVLGGILLVSITWLITAFLCYQQHLSC